jgi:hypothetical protein
MAARRTPSNQAHGMGEEEHIASQINHQRSQGVVGSSLTTNHAGVHGDEDRDEVVHGDAGGGHEPPQADEYHSGKRRKRARLLLLLLHAQCWQERSCHLPPDHDLLDHGSTHQRRTVVSPLFSVLNKRSTKQFHFSVQRDRNYQA